MSEAPTSIELVIRIGEAPPPAAALDRWSEANWSHHADPYEGMVQLGRSLFASRATGSWAADAPRRMAVLITLRDRTAGHLGSAIANHVRASEVWLASPDDGLVEVVPSGLDPTVESAPADRRSQGGSGDRTVSAEEIRLLLGEFEQDADGEEDPG